MGDIDFDELDKAVNLLAQSGASQKQDDALPPADPPVQDSTPVAVSPVAVPDAPKAVQHPTEPPKPEHPHRPVRISRPVGRRRGSFMDVVTSRPVSREGAKVQPTERLSTATTPPVATPNGRSRAATATPASDFTASLGATSQPAPTPVAPAASAATLRDNQPASAEPWPDPLEFHGYATPETPETTQPIPPTPEATPSEPSVSPFLTDAKVKKRPLGAFSPAEQPAEYIPSVPDAIAHIQPELQSPADATPEAAPSTPEPVVPASEPTSQDSLQKVAAMAIPQQYRTANAPTDTSHRPVFDTTEYHPPLLEAHSHHKNHGARIGLILALLSIATLVAVGGYLVFIYLTQGR